MKVGDLVTFKPEDWGTPLEDRPIGVVVSEPWRPAWGSTAILVDIQFPSDPEVYSTSPETLEILSESR